MNSTFLVTHRCDPIEYKMAVDETEEVIYTTNAEDQNAVAELRKRLAQSDSGAQTGQGNDPTQHSWTPVPSISIDEGANKYVLISATEPFPTEGSNQCYTNFFVTSKRGADYHRNAAEPYVDLLQSSGYRDINITGGGRIYFSKDEKKISIYGYSYGFGLADHSISQEEIERDGRFQGYDISWTNDGY
jgi:phosphohistidine phosphatase